MNGFAYATIMIVGTTVISLLIQLSVRLRWFKLDLFTLVLCGFLTAVWLATIVVILNVVNSRPPSFTLVIALVSLNFVAILLLGLANLRLKQVSFERYVLRAALLQSHDFHYM